MTKREAYETAADNFISLGGRMTKPQCYADARRIWPRVHPNARRGMVDRILKDGDI